MAVTSKMTSRHGLELARGVGHRAPTSRGLPHQRADETSDDSADDGRNRRDASGMMDDDRRRAVVMMDVVMPRRRRAAVMDRRGTAASVMRRGNCRARGKGDARNDNHDCLDDLVHITPATFCFDVPQGPVPRLQKARALQRRFLTKFFAAVQDPLELRRPDAGDELAILLQVDSNVFKYFRIRQTHLSEYRDWQGRPESNRRSWIWSPGHNHYATPLWLGWPDSNRQLSH